MTRLKLACATSFVSCALVVGAHVPAMAAVPMNSDPTGELDQSAGFSDTGWSSGLDSSTQLAQSFTAGLSGELTTVGVGIARNGTVTDLTIEISSATGGLPSGAPLASTTLSGPGLSVIANGQQQMFTVDFDSPAQVVQGSAYAIVASTTGGSFYWYDSNVAGQAALNQFGLGWKLDTSYPEVILTFATYVTAFSPSSVGISESTPARPVLSLTLPDGVQCATSTLTAAGQWIALPSSSDCTITPREGGDDSTLLGWATRADFPAAIAQRQVDNGWGPYETYGDDGRLTGVFIPAGGHTAVTGDTNLYPIWS